MALMNQLRSGSVEVTRISTMYTVDQARTPELYTEITTSDEILPKGYLIKTVTSADVETVKLTDGVKPWDELLVIGTSEE